MMPRQYLATGFLASSIEQAAATVVGLGTAYGGVKPVPPCAMISGSWAGRPGTEESVRIPAVFLKRRSHSALSAAVWFHASSLWYLLAVIRSRVLASRMYSRVVENPSRLMLQLFVGWHVLVGVFRGHA
jgi:hypothetical protein